MWAIGTTYVDELWAEGVLEVFQEVFVTILVKWLWSSLEELCLSSLPMLFWAYSC